MRILSTVTLLFVTSSAMAGGPLVDNSTNQAQAQVAVQVAKASQQIKVDGSPTTVTGSDYDAAAIAPNPMAHSPSAQCRYGTSVTGAAVGFGAGISVSDWDRICGLWMAAQQTTGAAQKEAAAAAFCLTMQDAKVHSEVCVAWEKGQGQADVAMNTNEAQIVFGGAADRR
jgi:hypothetical protein